MTNVVTLYQDKKKDENKTPRFLVKEIEGRFYITDEKWPNLPLDDLLSTKNLENANTFANRLNKQEQS